ncbi:MAG: Maf family protein [Candidatus Thorarchaeota archaeon]
MKKIILASKSHDRSELFIRLNIPFEVLNTDVNEDKYKSNYFDPIQLAEELARVKVLKAKGMLVNEEIGTVIIAADTIVEIKGRIIGKPQNEIEAIDMLKALVNRSHNLITGIAITEIGNSKVLVDHDKTVVTLLNLSDHDIREYVSAGEWKGRAGAYSSRDRASLFIKEIQGSPSNVIGLPMQKIFELLKNQYRLNLLEC